MERQFTGRGKAAHGQGKGVCRTRPSPARPARQPQEKGSTSTPNRAAGPAGPVAPPAAAQGFVVVCGRRGAAGLGCLINHKLEVIRAIMLEGSP